MRVVRTEEELSTLPTICCCYIFDCLTVEYDAKRSLQVDTAHLLSNFMKESWTIACHFKV